MFKLGDIVWVTWGNISDNELGRIVSLGDKNKLPEVEFADGIISQVPNYLMMNSRKAS
jgi:hypothetical protein